MPILALLTIILVSLRDQSNNQKTGRIMNGYKIPDYVYATALWTVVAITIAGMVSAVIGGLVIMDAFFKHIGLG